MKLNGLKVTGSRNIIYNPLAKKKLRKTRLILEKPTSVEPHFLSELDSFNDKHARVPETHETGLIRRFSGLIGDYQATHDIGFVFTISETLFKETYGDKFKDTIIEGVIHDGVATQIANVFDFGRNVSVNFLDIEGYKGSNANIISIYAPVVTERDIIERDLNRLFYAESRPHNHVRNIEKLQDRLHEVFDFARMTQGATFDVRFNEMKLGYTSKYGYMGLPEDIGTLTLVLRERDKELFNVKRD